VSATFLVNGQTMHIFDISILTWVKIWQPSLQKWEI